MSQLHRLALSMRASSTAGRIPALFAPLAAGKVAPAASPVAIFCGGAHAHGAELLSAMQQRTMRPMASWASRSMSTTTEGEAGGAAAAAGEKAAEEAPAVDASAGAAGVEASQKKRPQRARRDDGPNEDYNPPPIQPILSSETKNLIYELHMKDPAENSELALAARFGVSDLRVKAIIMLGKRYAERVKEGLLHPAGLEMEKHVERVSGTVKSGFNSSFYQPDRDGFRGMQADAQERNIKARPRPLFDVIDTHKAKKAMARLDEKYSGAGSFNPKAVELERLRAAAAAEVPVAPLHQKHGVAATMSKKWKYVFADISKGVTGPKRMVVVRDPNGKCRAADFDERFRVEQFVSPPKLPPS